MNHEFDHTNPEHHLEIADAIRAIEETESPQSVEYLHPDGTWRTNLCAPDNWNKAFRHRRAPVPAVKWWSEPSHVPPECWIREKGGGNSTGALEVIQVSTAGIGTKIGFSYWRDLEETEWSSTHLGPFKHCTVPC